MLGIFFWLVSFQHRNPLISDGEDTLFRWFAFLMIFLPLDCGWSLWRRYRQRVGVPIREYTSADAWALRLMQVQMSVIYASAAYNKLLGETWRDGTALYFVSYMNDHFGRLPLSTMLFDSLWLVRAQTWSVLAIEGLLPVALWIPRLRPWAIAVGITLHLGIELTMHLFLFEWIMILGLASFIQPHRAKVGSTLNQGLH
ncbi:MAG: HTTM domain-containing protein [Pirellulaceae bacterium]|nr:HTTM domain-containing protein [Pirellulaceae bacterium]